MKYNRLQTKTIPLLTIITCLGLGSCKTMEPVALSEVEVAGHYRDIEKTDTTTIADIPWDKLFADPKLQTLINEALENNSDVKIAVERIKIAEANLQASTLGLFPSLSINGSSSNIFKEGSERTDTYQLYGASSWEIDIWGKNISSRKAYKASLLQSEAYLRSVQTRLIANVAISYFNLLALDEQLRITGQTLEKRKESVVAIMLLKESNIVNGAAVVQSQASMYSTEVSMPSLRQEIFEAENNFCSLLGRQASPIDRGKFNEQAISVDLKTGIPVQLLANRPDVQQAGSQVDYYMQMLNVAKKSFYPSITITAQGGLTDANLSELFNPIDLFSSIIGGIAQPIFNQGKNRQKYKSAQANLEEGLISYKQTILDASNEVTGYLHSYQSATEKLGIRAKQIESLEKSVDFTRELLEYSSTTNYTDVLTSEQSLLSAQLSGINDKLEQLQAIVNLYRSLGGGWKLDNN